jgi:hypothetical protein
MAEPTEAEIHALFDGPAVRCGCGHLYEEMPEQDDADWTEDGDPIDPLELEAVIAAAQTMGSSSLVVLDWRCPECGTTDAPALVTVNHLDEYEKAWKELGDHFAMIAERKPEMREQLEAMIDQAYAHAETIFARVFKGAAGSTA